MNRKKFYTLLCLLGLTGQSNGINQTENDVSVTEKNDILNSNQEKDSETKSTNLKKKNWNWIGDCGWCRSFIWFTLCD